MSDQKSEPIEFDRESKQIQERYIEPTIEVVNTVEPIDSMTTEEIIVDETLLLPALPTNVKSFTDYRVYNLLGTPHYRLQARCGTDEWGLRRFGADYCVAVGSFYSTDIGDRFEVTLDTGNVITVIVADTKADRDTDEQHMYSSCMNYDGENSANIFEFIVDSDTLPKTVYAYGSVDCISGLNGNIQKMTYLGRDGSGDWTSYE
ncbi:MAG: hypothetical protein NC084_04100 [Bacteroides sp.]|nr:hypothetical protein [Eubacterium sp.]MCM1417652.1 hypothetical protein [Roseburia sp.]MCM1461883.1 hypothetical protein [Bacteroides sp.]